MKRFCVLAVLASALYAAPRASACDRTSFAFGFQSRSTVFIQQQSPLVFFSQQTVLQPSFIVAQQRFSSSAFAFQSRSGGFGIRGSAFQGGPVSRFLDRAAARRLTR